MRKVTPGQLETGMVLAKPILRGNMVFLNEGAVLTDSSIARIETMGIDSIFIEGRAEQSIPRDKALALLDKRFTNTMDDPLMAHIKTIVREYIEGRYE